MKPLMLRWNLVPSYLPEAQSARKFCPRQKSATPRRTTARRTSQASGASSQKSSSFMSPTLVCNVTAYTTPRTRHHGRLLEDLHLLEAAVSRTTLLPASQLEDCEHAHLPSSHQSGARPALRGAQPAEASPPSVAASEQSRTTLIPRSAPLSSPSRPGRRCLAAMGGRADGGARMRSPAAIARIIIIITTEVMMIRPRTIRGRRGRSGVRNSGPGGGT
eukprot:scaffold1575_cov352-Prasinococcus_capsulatus_cf.AAC.6